MKKPPLLKEGGAPVSLSAAGAKDLLFPYIGRRCGRPGRRTFRAGGRDGRGPRPRAGVVRAGGGVRASAGQAALLAPFVALAIIIVLVSVMQLPYTKAALSAQFSQMPNMPPEAAQRALSFASIGIIAAPIVYALILSVNALMLWVLVSVVGGEAKFATLLSVTTYASISYILLTVVGLVVLTVRGSESIGGVEDLQPALGLDLLAPGAKGLTLALLRGINQIGR